MKTLKEFKKGQDIGKKNVGPDTGFKNLANKASKEYGSKEAGERVAGAVLQKILHKEEADLEEAYDAEKTKAMFSKGPNGEPSPFEQSFRAGQEAKGMKLKPLQTKDDEVEAKPEKKPEIAKAPKKPFDPDFWARDYKLKEEIELDEAVTASQLMLGHYGSDHGGALHYSNVDGRQHNWNFVKKNTSGDKYEVTPHKSEAAGISHEGKFLKFPFRESVEGGDSGITSKEEPKKKSLKSKLTDMFPVANPTKAPFSEEVDFDKPAPVPSHFIVTGPVGDNTKKYKNRASANRAVDKRDNEYGAYRHNAKAVYESVEGLDEIALSPRMTKKFEDDVRPQALGNAMAAAPGSKEESKAKATLKFIEKLRNKKDLMRFSKSTNESVHDLHGAKQDLLDHVTNNVANQETIGNMHDKIHKIGELGGDTEKEYDNIKNNECIDKGFRNAASLD